MKNLYLTSDSFPDGFFDGAVARILELQRADGSIPWFDGGVVDPWNHIEAAMGLAVAGRRDAAEKAYAFLKDNQNKDGSWWGEYGSAVPMDESHYTGDGNEKKIRDTNFCAYIATGVWHHHLLFEDREFLAAYYPVVKQAIGFVLSWQAPEGDIRWAADDELTPENDALITGCASIYKSLECAVRLAKAAGDHVSAASWAVARSRLGEALRNKPERFDRTWESKERYSMDWYYPVLAGAVSGEAAKARIAEKWDIFVAEGQGCRCVMDHPWVTVAESCELVLALLAIGERQKAQEVFSWQHQWRAADGAYWMGYQYEADTPWPDEKPAWTSASVILAADALVNATSSSGLFTDILPEVDPGASAVTLKTSKKT